MKKLLPFFILLILVACSKEQNVEMPDENLPQTINEGEMILGKKLPNPYSLENMQAAYNEMSRTRSTPEYEITPTDLYVRFLPADTAELQLLYNDSLELFAYPMDYDIVQEGSYYHDPSIPEGQITWQYTTVKPDYKFPKVRYEVLEKCFIPEEEDDDDEEYDEDDDDITRSASLSFAEELEMLAFQRLNLLEKFTHNGDPETRGLFSKSYKPTGRLTVYDTYSKKQVPIKGVKVRCHVLVKWSTAWTDENGNYTMGSKFSIGPHYAIVFDNMKDFTIWGNWGPLAAANFNMGWHNKKGYSKDINTNASAWDWANVNNAAYDYYKMCEQTGIPKPPANLKIANFRNFEKSSASMMRRIWQPLGIQSNSTFITFFANMHAYIYTSVFGTLTKFAHPDITIGSSGYNSDIIYRNVFHELSHASHFRKVGASYWADYINYIVTYGAYGNGSGKNAGICAVGEMWGYAMGNYAYKEKYGKTTLHGSENWFKYRIIYDLIDENILTKKQIIDCMNSKIKSSGQLKQEMINKYPSKKTEIINTFKKHE